MRAYHKTPEKFRSAGEKTHGKGKHKAHKVGERISFKTPKGRTSGKIVAVHKEFYTVVNKNTEYKVNRNSILYLMGTKKITDVNGQSVNTGPVANSIPKYRSPIHHYPYGKPVTSTDGYTYTKTGPYQITVTDPNGRVIGIQMMGVPYKGPPISKDPVILKGPLVPVKTPPKTPISPRHEPDPIWNDVRNRYDPNFPKIYRKPRGT